MVKRIEVTKAFIYSLANNKPSRRKIILQNASNAELKGLFELCLNIVRGNLPVDSKTLQSLKRNRKTLETLGNRRVALYKKREIINQKGGFLGTIATFALPLLTHLIAAKLSRRK